MKEPTREQVLRLPQWAHAHIEDSRRRISDAARTIDELRRDQPAKAYWRVSVGTAIRVEAE